MRSSWRVDHDVLAAPDAGVQEPRPRPGDLLGPGPHVSDVVKLGPGQRLVNHPLGDPALQDENGDTLSRHLTILSNDCTTCMRCPVVKSDGVISVKQWHALSSA